MAEESLKGLGKVLTNLSMQMRGGGQMGKGHIGCLFGNIQA